MSFKLNRLKTAINLYPELISAECTSVEQPRLTSTDCCAPFSFVSCRGRSYFFILKCVKLFVHVQQVGSVSGTFSSEVGLCVYWVLESTGLYCSWERREDYSLGEHRCHNNNCTTTQVNISTHAEANISAYSHKLIFISVRAFVSVVQTSVGLRVKHWRVWSLFPSKEKLSPLQTMTTYEDISSRYKWTFCIFVFVMIGTLNKCTIEIYQPSDHLLWCLTWATTK